MIARRTPRAYAEALVAFLADAQLKDQPKILRAFVRLLAKHGMLHYAARIVDEVERLTLQEEGMLLARIEVAQAPGEEGIEGIEQVLRDFVGQPVKASISVHPQLIAGFRARVEDLLVESSVRGALSRLRAQLAHP